MVDKLTNLWKIPLILSLTSLTVLVVLNLQATSNIDSLLFSTQNNQNNNNTNSQIVYPWKANFSQRYQMDRSNNINITATATWQCCGFGHRFNYHSSVYEYTVRNDKALLIFWPTRNGQCYSNIVGNNYSINDLFPELFDFKQINKGGFKNTDIHSGDILALNPSYILPSFDPKTAQRQPQLNQQLIEDTIADSVIIGSEKTFHKRRIIQINHPGGLPIFDNKYKRHFYFTLTEHFSQKVLTPLEKFIKDKQLLSNNSNLITVHIRQGNNEKGHFRYTHRRNKVKTLAYIVNEQIQYLTSKTKQKNWKIFVASDNVNTINTLRKICQYEVITRDQIRPKKGVWFGQMGTDMPKNCLDTSITGLVDMMLLTIGDIFLFPSGSTFNYLPQMMVAENDGIVCGVSKNNITQQWHCRIHDNVLTEYELNRTLSRF